MKKILLLTLIIYTSCADDTDKYNHILEGLTKNYTLLEKEMGQKLYLEHYKLTLKEHEEEKSRYNKSIIDFYNSETEILAYLLRYEKEEDKICQWIKTRNPYSAVVTNEQLISNKQGALILFDNYLRKTNQIKIPENYRLLSFEKMKNFYKANKHLKISDLRKKYKELIVVGELIRQYTRTSDSVDL